MHAMKDIQFKSYGMQEGVMKQYVPWAFASEVDPTLQFNYQLTKYVQKLSIGA